MIEHQVNSTTMAEIPKKKWSKQWVPQDTVLNSGKCIVSKWITEEKWNTLQEKVQEEEKPPEPDFEVVFLCKVEGCGRTFKEAPLMRKHSQTHVEMICPYDGCEMKFLDPAKFKRHLIMHTAENQILCPIEGCGKIFSSDINLNQHLKMHSRDIYHTCPYKDCGKRYIHESKLRTHIKTYHEKSMPPDATITPRVDHYAPNAQITTPVAPAGTSDRPFSCPYSGCNKFYKHAYKLKLHLRREHESEYPNLTGETANGGHTLKHSAIEETGNFEPDGDAHKSGINTTSGYRMHRIVQTPSPLLGTKRKLSNEISMNSSSKPYTMRTEILNQEESEEDSEKTEDDAEGEGLDNRMREETDTDEDDEETEDERN